MRPYGWGREVLHPTQNLKAYNIGRYSQNQHGTIYTTYAPYVPNPPYLHQDPIGYMTYAPYPQYSQQEIGYTTYAPYPLYSQQEIGARLLQDPMASEMVLQDQNWFFQNRYRRESMPEYKNGEVVMVRCNQQKWLNGVIQKISAQGIHIWITDANVLVNVPLVLLPTHVLKMSTYSKIESLLQAEPMWTIIDNGGYQKVLVQCVRPAHLSHRQLFRVLDTNRCAICKSHIPNLIDKVNPWNCRHQVHNHCLQLQVQRSSTTTCPFCNENATRQLMPLTYSNYAFANASNRQQQQPPWFDLQCTCGFRSAVSNNLNVPIFCPNCHQPIYINPMMMDIQSDQQATSMNINPMTIKMQNRETPTSMNVNPMTIIVQSDQPHASMNLSRTHSKSEKNILQSSKSSKILESERFFSVQDFRFEWPTQSFNNSNRLEAIEEGQEENTSSLESTTIDQGHEKRSYSPLYLQALCETFKNNDISYPNVVAMRPNHHDMQPPSSFQSSWHDGLLYKPSRTQTTLIQNKQHSSAQSSLQDGSLGVPYPTSTTPIQNERSNSQSVLHDGSMDATSLFPTTPILSGQSSSQSFLLDGSMDAPSHIPTTLIQNKQFRNNALSPMQLTISSATPTPVTHVNLVEKKEADELTDKLEIDKTTITATKGHKLWKKASEPNTTIVVTEDHILWNKASEANMTIKGQKLWRKASATDWTSKLENNAESKEVEEANSSNYFAASSSSATPMYVNHFTGATKGQKLWKSASAVDSTSKLDNNEDNEESEATNLSNDPSSAPMYVNHFADFVKLAMANSSIAKDIIASASTSASPSTSNPLPLESATSLWISPPPALFTQASSLFSEAPTWITHNKSLDEVASASSAWITVIKDGVDSRKDDKRWELERLARAKGSNFL